MALTSETCVAQQLSEGAGVRGAPEEPILITRATHLELRLQVKASAGYILPVF